MWPLMMRLCVEPNSPIADLPQQATRGPFTSPHLISALSPSCHPTPSHLKPSPSYHKTLHHLHVENPKLHRNHSNPHSTTPKQTRMTLQTAHDIPLQISSENASAERRITPSWSVAQLKTKLEPVTGIPPSSQRLTLRLPDQEGIPIEAEDEERVQLARWPLQPYAEIQVRL